MTTLRSYPYWGVKREVLQEIRRRAQEERAKVLRQLFAAPGKVVRHLFAALASWRRKASAWRAATGLTLKVAQEH
jgi:predicted DCC family thiol-disulfide oxidoreductase YuxK